MKIDRRKNRLLLAAPFVLGLAAPPIQQAMAQGGGPDRDGCFQETATGRYHCDRKMDDKDGGLKTAGHVPGGLPVVRLAYEAVSDKELFSAGPLRIAPQFAENGEAGFVAEYRLNALQRLGFRTDDLMDGGRGGNHVKAHWRLKS